MVLEAKKFTIWVSAHLLLVEDPLLGLQKATLSPCAFSGIELHLWSFNTHFRVGRRVFIPGQREGKWTSGNYK